MLGLPRRGWSGGTGRGGAGRGAGRLCPSAALCRSSQRPRAGWLPRVPVEFSGAAAGGEGSVACGAVEEVKLCSVFLHKLAFFKWRKVCQLLNASEDAMLKHSYDFNLFTINAILKRGTTAEVLIRSQHFSLIL